MAKFAKGYVKPPSAGAKKGQKYKKKVPDLYEGLLDKGCDYDQELGKAILAKDAVMIRALSDLLPYIRPRFKETEKKEESPTDETLKEITTEQLLKSVANE
jgi:hypothetical protein